MSNCDWGLILLTVIRRGSNEEVGLASSVGLGKNTSVSPHLSDKLTGWKFSFFFFFFP